MATNLKHTLLNLEVAPPPGVWTDIAARLGSEYDAADTPVAQKMYELSVTAPAGIWSELSAKLNTQSEAATTAVGKKIYDLAVTPPANAWNNIVEQLRKTGHSEGKLISLHSRKAIAAAAAMLLLTIGAWYFLDKANNSADNNNVATRSTTSPGTDKLSTLPSRKRAADTELGERPVATVERIGQKPLAALTTENGFGNRHGRRTAWYDYQPIATSYASLDERSVEFTDENSAAVDAPLIRDANGQVILDKKLITSPDDCYINITSPNGEQTRISSKFLHIISTLNDDVEQQDYFDFMMHENSLWKIRFHEWREKFMNQASFVPTPTSFTDILELKDLLIENDKE